MIKPDMTLVGWLAKKHHVNGEIKGSTRRDKKLMVKHDGKWIHFGNPSYEDYTIHRDKKRQERYCARAKNIRNKKGLAGNDPNSPNYYAMRLLWDCKP